jgi:CheY-like chemotaxis protein
MGFTDLALMELENPQKLRIMLEQVRKASLRARDLVAQILTFCRKAENERRPMVIYPIIKEALKLLRSTIPSTIEIKTNITVTPERIRADPTEIHQIMMNLCTNSFQAMKNERGILEVNLETVMLDKKSVRQLEDITPGKYLKLTVCDNGAGITRETQEHIYDPFFTTKKEGVGTGLGLSVVHGIVKEYRGTIKLTSTIGKGTCFTIYFPIIVDSGMEEEQRPLTFAGGAETILFIDDDPTLTAVTTTMLKSLGYSVISTSDSLAALELFRSNAADFDLVLTDQTMPGLPGSELIAEFLKIRPDIKMIICTGYSSIIDEDKAAELGFKGFLPKPFKFERLARTIRRVLDDKPVN